MITLSGLVSIVIYLLVAGAIIGLLFYLIHVVPIPEPYKVWLAVGLTVVEVACFLWFKFSV